MTDVITVTASVEVWKAVRRALQRAPEENPFYHALVLEIESALQDHLDEYHKALDEYLKGIE